MGYLTAEYEKKIKDLETRLLVWKELATEWKNQAKLYKEELDSLKRELGLGNRDSAKYTD